MYDRGKGDESDEYDDEDRPRDFRDEPLYEDEELLSEDLSDFRDEPLLDEEDDFYEADSPAGIKEREDLLREARAKVGKHGKKVLETRDNRQQAEVREGILGGSIKVKPRPGLQRAKAKAIKFGIPQQANNAEWEDNQADAMVESLWYLNPINEWKLSETSAARAYRMVFIVKQFHGKQDEQEMALQRFDLSAFDVDVGDVSEFFEREYLAVEELNGKDHTLEMTQWVIEDHWGYIMTPAPKHPDLLEYVKAALYLGWEPESIWDVFGYKAARQMSQAILYMNSKGLGHGDLKLDNMFVSEVAPIPELIGGEPSVKKKSKVPIWLQMDVDDGGPLQIAIDSLQKGVAPSEFTLASFGQSGPLQQKKESRNSLSVADIDEHMWITSLSQLWDASDELDRQMRSQNLRYFINKGGSVCSEDETSDGVEFTTSKRRTQFQELLLATIQKKPAEMDRIRDLIASCHDSLNGPGMSQDFMSH
jgi:hypothetical protein